jgi:hypothetical protein
VQTIIYKALEFTKLSSYCNCYLFAMCKYKNDAIGNDFTATTILRPKTRVERRLAWDNAFTRDLCFLACNIFGVFG